MWDVETGQETFRRAADRNLAYAVALAPDGKRLATVGWTPQVRIWDVASREQTHTFAGDREQLFTRVAFRRDGLRLATGSWDGRVQVWDATPQATSVEASQPLHTFRHGERILCVAFNPRLPQLASGSSDDTVKVWDTNTGKELATLRGHTGLVWSLA
jgi:WD40 repeat protein